MFRGTRRVPARWLGDLMPLPPYTWQANDFFSAWRLNAELYQTQGIPFQPMGVAFHAAKPIYKAAMYTIGPPAPTWVANQWSNMGNTGAAFDESWIVQADSGGYYGARLDPRQVGCIDGQLLQNGGGDTSRNGGLGIVFTFASVSAGVGRVGAGIGPNGGASVTTQGTFQVGTAAQASTAWALDLIDLNANGTNALTGWVFATAASPTPAITNNDGSGSNCRISAQWAAVNQTFSSTVAALPGPQATWTSSSPLSAALMNGSAGINQIMTLLNSPPTLRVVSTATQSVANAGATAINMPGATYDSYSGWNSSANTYTVPLSGLYLLYGAVPWASQSNVAATTLQINGTDYFGPKMYANGGASLGTAKVGIFSLNAGDTIRLRGFQQSGGALNTAVGSVLVGLFLGQAGAPAVLPKLPDVTYRWSAGTPNTAMPGLLNAHLANDLLFLAQKPYFLGYANSAQSGIAQNTPTSVKIDTVSGLVHGDAGDPWSGWNSGSNVWVAPRNGWYLAVQETFMAQPPTDGGMNIAAFKCSQPGASPTDQYQAAQSSNAFNGGGAAGINYYYLRAGDSLSPYIRVIGTSGSSVSTTVAAGFNSHFELVWIGE